MRVKVVYLGHIRISAGTKEEAIDLENTANLSDLLALLIEKHRFRFKDAIFDPRTNALRPYVLILINGQDYRLLGMLNAKLQDGDSVALLHPVEGG